MADEINGAGTSAPAAAPAAKPEVKPAELSPLQQKFQAAIEEMKAADGFQKQANKFEDLVGYFGKAVDTFTKVNEEMKNANLDGAFSLLSGTIGGSDPIIKRLLEEEFVTKNVGVDENGNPKTQDVSNGNQLTRFFGAMNTVMVGFAGLVKKMTPFINPEDGAKPIDVVAADAFSVFNKVIAALNANNITESFKTLSDIITANDGIIKNLTEEQVKIIPGDTVPDPNDPTKMIKNPDKTVPIGTPLTRFFDTITKVITGFQTMASKLPTVAYGDLTASYEIGTQFIESSIANLKKFEDPLYRLYDLIDEMANPIGCWQMMVTPDAKFRKVMKQVKMMDREKVDAWDTKVSTDAEGKETTTFTLKKDLTKWGEEQYEYALGGEDMSPFDFLTFMVTATFGGVDKIRTLFKSLAENSVDSRDMRYGVQSMTNFMYELGPCLDDISKAMDKTMKYVFDSNDEGTVIKLRKLAENVENMTKVFTSLDGLMKTAFTSQSIWTMMKAMGNMYIMTGLYEKFFYRVNWTLKAMWGAMTEGHSAPPTAAVVEKDAKDETVQKAVEAAANGDKALQGAVPDQKGAEEDKKAQEEAKKVEPKNMPANPWDAIPTIIAKMEEFKKLPMSVVSIAGYVTGAAALIAPAIAALPMFALFLKVAARDILWCMGWVNTGITTANAIAKGTQLLDGKFTLGAVMNELKANVLPIFEPLSMLLASAYLMMKTVVKIGIVSIPARLMWKSTFKLFNDIVQGVMSILKNLAELQLYIEKEKKKAGVTLGDYNPLNALMQVIKGMWAVVGTLVALSLVMILTFPLMIIGLVGFTVLTVAIMGILVAVAVISTIYDGRNDPMKPLLMFMASMLLMIGAIFLVGYLVYEYGKIMETGIEWCQNIVIGLIGILLGIGAATRLMKGSGMMQILAMMVSMIIFVALIYAVAYIIKSVGELVMETSQAVLDSGILTCSVILAAIVAIAVAATFAAPYLTAALAGMAILLAAAGTFMATIWCIKQIGEMIIEIGSAFRPLLWLESDEIAEVFEKYGAILGGILSAVIQAIDIAFDVRTIAKLTFAAGAMVSVKMFADSLTPLAQGLMGFATMEFYDEKQKKVYKLTQDDIDNAIINIATVMTTVFAAVFDIVNENPELFKDSLFTNSPIAEAFNNISKIGDLLWKTSEGLCKLQDMKDIDGAVEKTKLLFSRFGEIINCALGLEDANGGKHDAIKDKRGGFFGAIADFFVGEKTVAPIQAALDQVGIAFSDDNTKGLNNMFDVVGRWTDMTEKLGKETAKATKSSADAGTVVKEFTGLFSGPSAKNVAYWSVWSEKVGELAENLKNVCDEFERMGEILADNSESMADFCANVIKLIEEETGVDVFKRAGESGASGREEGEAKEANGKAAKLAELKDTASKILESLNGLNEKVGGTLCVKTKLGDIVDTRNVGF